MSKVVFKIKYLFSSKRSFPRLRLYAIIFSPKLGVVYLYFPKVYHVLPSDTINSRFQSVYHLIRTTNAQTTTLGDTSRFNGPKIEPTPRFQGTLIHVLQYAYQRE